VIGAIAVNQRGTEQTDCDDRRPLMLLDAEQRHESENATLTSLSMLIATVTYFTDVTMMSVQMISDRRPRMMSGVGAPPVRLRTVLSV